MEQFLNEHWGKITLLGSGVVGVVSILFVWLGKKIYTVCVWAKDEVIRPIVEGHLAYLKTTAAEAVATTEVLSTVSEDARATADAMVQQNEKLDAMINVLEELKTIMAASCKYEPNHDQHKPRQKKGGE